MLMKLPIFDPMCQECPHRGATYQTDIDSHPCHMVGDRRCVGYALTKKNVSDEVVNIVSDSQGVHITVRYECERW